jgi:hypothetical protein
LAVAVVAVLVLVGAVQLAGRVVDGLASWRATPTLRVSPDGVAGTAGSSSALLGPAPNGSAVYVVEPGDTLWSIARRLDPEGDPRPIVHRLSEQTGGAGLQPGQRLALDGLR